jgi:hypothetical protein
MYLATLTPPIFDADIDLQCMEISAGQIRLSYYALKMFICNPRQGIGGMRPLNNFLDTLTRVQVWHILLPFACGKLLLNNLPTKPLRGVIYLNILGTSAPEVVHLLML